MKEQTFDFTLKEDGFDLANLVLRIWSNAASDEECEDVFDAIAPKLRAGSRSDLDRFISIHRMDIPYLPYLFCKNATPVNVYYSRIGLIFNRMTISGGNSCQLGIVYHVAREIRDDLDLIWEGEDYINLGSEFAKEFKHFAARYRMQSFFISFIEILAPNSDIMICTDMNEQQYERVDQCLELIMSICKAILTRKWAVVRLGHLLQVAESKYFDKKNPKTLLEIYEEFRPVNNQIACDNIQSFKEGNYATQPIPLDDNELDMWDVSYIIGDESADFYKRMNRVRNISDKITLKLWKI